MGNRKPIWTTKDKRKMPISEMTDLHLVNSHRYLCRSLSEFISDLSDRDLSTVPIRLRGKVFDGISWISILEQEMKSRHLELLTTRPECSAIDNCEPRWRSNAGNLIPISQLADADLLQIHQEIRNRLIDLMDFYNFASSPLAPTEGTMAADDFEGAYFVAIEEEIFVINWIVIFNNEVFRRGLQARPFKKPRPRAKVISEKIYPGGGKIMELEWEEVSIVEI